MSRSAANRPVCGQARPDACVGRLPTISGEGHVAKDSVASSCACSGPCGDLDSRHAHADHLARPHLSTRGSTLQTLASFVATICPSWSRPASAVMSRRRTPVVDYALAEPCTLRVGGTELTIPSTLARPLPLSCLALAFPLEVPRLTHWAAPLRLDPRRGRRLTHQW
jgi:hypothetical protein